MVFILDCDVEIMSDLINKMNYIDLPNPLKKIKGRVKSSIDRLLYSSEYKSYYERIKKLHNIHKGQRCFIVGTGPSLQKTRLDLLKDEIVFGVNTLYKGLDKFNIWPKYYAISDKNVFNDHYKKVLPLDTTLFLSSGAGKTFLSNKQKYEKIVKNDPIPLRTKGYITVENTVSKDIAKYVLNGHTIVNDICLQVAYYLGFNEVYLLGCDCSYSGKVHHFDGDNYDFQYGGAKEKEFLRREKRRWDLTFKAYEICKKVFEESNMKIYNATVGGMLEVFERKSLEEIFDKGD